MKSVKWSRFVPWLLLVPTALAYSNCLSGAFLYDDFPRIVDNGDLEGFWSSILMSSRPLTQLTFFLNIAVCGLNRVCFHVVNLSIHLAAGVLLYGCVRRAMVFCGVKETTRATAIGALSALLWLLHPVQTESVTYLVQRSESLMGLFYFLTLYAVMVAERSPVSHRWETLAVCACALGMAAKPIMVTAPLVAILFDRCFLSGTFAHAVKRRKAFYAALFATWVIPVALLAAPNESASTVGFESGVASPWVYLATQTEVIVHYLRLLVWPSGLCLDYGWPPVAHWSQAALPGAFIVVLSGSVLYGLVRWRRATFPLAFFLVTLAPTSSLIPIADFAVEHRLYVPSAGIIVLAVVSCDALVRRWGRGSAGARRALNALGVALACAAAAGLGSATYRRNAMYRSGEGMYRDVLRKRPSNFRAHIALMKYLLKERRYSEAESVGTTLLGKIAHALETGGVEYAGSATSAPYFYGVVRNELGHTLLLEGRYREAEAELREALRVRSDYRTAQHNLALCLYLQGRRDEAIEVAERLREGGQLWPEARRLIEVIRQDEDSPGETPGLSP